MKHSIVTDNFQLQLNASGRRKDYHTLCHELYCCVGMRRWFCLLMLMSAAKERGFHPGRFWNIKIMDLFMASADVVLC